MWPKLEEKLSTMPDAEKEVDALRSADDMIAEILEISRAEANRRRKADSLDAFIPPFDELVPVLSQIQDALRTVKKQMQAAARSPSTVAPATVSASGSKAIPGQSQEVQSPSQA